jgi:hypothetical protein
MRGFRESIECPNAGFGIIHLTKVVRRTMRGRTACSQRRKGDNDGELIDIPPQPGRASRTGSSRH